MKEVKNMSIISKNNASKLHEDSVKPLSRKKACVNKIVASVAAILIAFTPNLGALKVDELLHMPEDQLSTTLHTTGRDDLLPLMPDLWRIFFEALTASRVASDSNADREFDCAIVICLGDVLAKDCFIDKVAAECTDHAAWNEAYANAWCPGGSAYNNVKEPRFYCDFNFKRLVEVLVRQTKRLQQSVQQN